MKVLMFGWEFPPFNSGGLGTACFGLTRGLSKEGVEIVFVMPRVAGADFDFLKIVATNIKKIKLRGITTLLRGYMTAEEYEQRFAHIKRAAPLSLYGQNLFEEVERYAQRAHDIAREEPHDIIHAHEWLTFKAGIAAKKVTGKPLVVHVHATEFDRTGGSGVNQYVYDIERAGMHAADAIIAVSNYTKSKIVSHYGIPADKVQVVHNAIDVETKNQPRSAKRGRTVLYLGRVTLQKGPDYFVQAAKKVLEKEPNTLFIIAGSGDMEGNLKDTATHLGIADKILFTGFLREDDITKAYELADLYVMPSVSEPFGLTSLEAASNRTPVLLSKQSGVCEVFSNCLKVDFWDISQMANKMLAVLRYKELQESLADNAYEEVKRMSWTTSAKKCVQLYRKLIT